MAKLPTFALFVSSVEGRLVTRYGTGRRGAPTYIGARRDAGDPTHIIWTPDVVIALTTEEVGRYRREYERELVAKSLTKRTEDDYVAQVQRELAPPPTPAPSSAAPPSPAPPPAASPASPSAAPKT